LCVSCISTRAFYVFLVCVNMSLPADDADSSEENTAPNSEDTPAVSAEDDDDSDAPLVLKVLPSSVTAES